MCGLIGYSGNAFVDPDEIKTLLLDAQSRGAHSTGVYGSHLFRFAGPANKAVEHHQFLSSIKDTKVVVGHTRYATMGKADKDNTHPYKIGEGANRVYGTHNGLIPRQVYKSTLENFKVEDPGVDSLAIYLILEKYNYDVNVLKDIIGTMALAFTDKEHLFLYRRSNKPLFTGRMDIESDNRTLKGLFYSSKQQGLKDIGCTDIKSLPADIMHVYKDGELLGVKYVEQNKISDQIYLDAGMTGWHTGVEDKLLKEVPELKHLATYSSYTNSTTGNSRSWGLSKQRGAAPARGMGAQSPIGFKQSGDNELNNLERISNMVRESLEADSLVLKEANFLTDMSVFDDEEFYNSCFVIIKLLDCRSAQGRTEYALPYFYMGLQSDVDQLHYPDCQGITNSQGITGLKLSPKQLTADLKLVMYAPLEGTTTAYAATISHKDLVNGRVLEVTLQIPFYEDKEKEEDEGTKTEGTSNSRREEYSNELPWEHEDEPSIRNSRATGGAKKEANRRAAKDATDVGTRQQGDSDKLRVVRKSAVDAETSLSDCALVREDFDTEEQYEDYCENIYRHINSDEYIESLDVEIEDSKLLNAHPVERPDEEVPFVNTMVMLSEKQYKAYAKVYNMELLMEDASELKRTSNNPQIMCNENHWVQLAIMKYPRRYLKEAKKNVKLTDIFPETEDFIDIMVKPANKIDAAEATYHNLNDRLEQFEEMLCSMREATDVGASEHTKDETLSSVYSQILTMYSEIREYTAEVKTLALEQGATFIKE